MKKLFMLLLVQAVFCMELGAAELRPAEVGPREFHSWLQDKSAIGVNTMSPIECGDHRIPGSLCIPCDDFDAMRTKYLSRKEARIVFYCDNPSCDCDAPLRALQSGYERVFVLRGGFAAWKAAGCVSETVDRVPRAPLPSISPASLRNLLKDPGDLFIIDIRSPKDFEAGHIEPSVNIPFSRLQLRYPVIPLNRKIIVVDERGLRSYLAASYLARKGFRDVRWLAGGMEEWRRQSTKKTVR